MTLEELGAMVYEWLPRLGLAHWQVRVVRCELKGAEAEAMPADSYDTATIRFSEDSVNWNREHAEGVVLHELMHLLTRDLAVAVVDTYPLLERPARRMAKARFDHELEGVVDRVALLIRALAAQRALTD